MFRCLFTTYSVKLFVMNLQIFVYNRVFWKKEKQNPKNLPHIENESTFWKRTMFWKLKLSLGRILKGQSVLAICSEGCWDCWVWRGARPMSLIWLSSRGCEIYADPPLGPDPAASCPNLTLLSLWFQTTRSYHGVKRQDL